MPTEKKPYNSENYTNALRILMSRRSVIKLMLGTVGAAALSSFPTSAEAISQSPYEAAAAEEQHALATFELEMQVAASELDTDFISTGVTADSILLDQRDNPNPEARAAALERTLDDPVSETISTMPGTETDSTGKEIPYTDYVIKYKGEVCTARVKTIDSQDTTTLSFQFNVSGPREDFINKPITVITYNSDSPITNEHNKVTLYCLQSYYDDDETAHEFALNPSFYEDVLDNTGKLKHVLKEEFTTLLFAEAFPRSAIEKISQSVSMESFNKLRASKGGRLIRNSSIILSKKFTKNVAALAHTPPEGFYTDDGSLSTPDFADTESQMHQMASIHSHELAHATQRLFKDGQPWSYSFVAQSRDQLGESQAEMAQAYFWYLMGDSEASKQTYKAPLFTSFIANSETGMYDFKSYSPLLFALLLVPYAQDLASAVSQTSTIDASNKMITLEELHQLGNNYMQARDEMMDALDPSWYVDWRNRIHSYGGYRSDWLTITHVEVYAPLLYARYKAQNKDPAADKEMFMEYVNQELEQNAFSVRTKFLEDVLKFNPNLNFPYVLDSLQSAHNLTMQTPEPVGSGVTLPVPELDEKILIKRKIDPVYLSEELATSDEYYYRKFHPYYFLHKIVRAPEAQEFVLEKDTADTDFQVVVIEQSDHFISTQLLQGNQLILHPDKQYLITVLDKRENQIDDDLSKTTPEIFSITSQRRTTPTPTPTETPATPEPTPVSPTPTPVTPEPTITPTPVTPEPPMTPTPVPVTPTPPPGLELNLPFIKT
jgi:hypothetical protein